MKKWWKEKQVVMCSDRGTPEINFSLYVAKKLSWRREEQYVNMLKGEYHSYYRCDPTQTRQKLNNYHQRRRKGKQHTVLRHESIQIL
jgi:hypothetical protein